MRGVCVRVWGVDDNDGERVSNCSSLRLLPVPAVPRHSSKTCHYFVFPGHGAKSSRRPHPLVRKGRSILFKTCEPFVWE